LVNEVQAVKPQYDCLNFLCKSVYGNRLPDMQTGCAAWILAGGAHHTCYLKILQPNIWKILLSMAVIEFVLIGKDTGISQFKNELRWNDVYYQLNKS
jgi:L-arabinose isomerase